MLDIILAFLPGAIHARIRRLLGQEIHPDARISFGVVIRAEAVQIGPRAHIRPLVRIRANSFRLGADSTIGPLAVIAAHDVIIGSSSGVSPINVISGDPEQSRSVFAMGNHTRIFPFCWLEPGHGIRLGDRVGIGGHGLIFTHGSWANYFLGAPVSFGPVTIEDGVWLPWRVFVMPNVRIGARAIVGAGSVVTRDIPPNSLAAGSPAKVVRSESYTQLTTSDLKARMLQVVARFKEDNPTYSDLEVLVSAEQDDLSQVSSARVILVAGIAPEDIGPLIDQRRSVIDVTKEKAWIASADTVGRDFASWLSRYGVRVDIQS